MALSKEIYGAVGTPRIYIDYVQYAKAMGYVKYYYGRFLDNVTGTYADAWDFNPTKTTTYQADSGGQYQRLGVVFNNSDIETGVIPTPSLVNDSLRDLQFRNLLSTINYFGLLNHNLGEYFNNANNPEQRLIDLGNTVGHSNDFQIVGHNPNINDIGYSLFGVNYFSSPEPKYLEGLYIQIKTYSADNSGILGTYPLLNLGTITAGRYFDFPVNPDLNVSINFDYSGIKSAKNISGDEMTSINYHQSPNWGNLAPWTNIDLTPYQEQGIDPQQALLDQDYRAVRKGGRRTFKLSFSYIDKEDMFPKNFEGNLSGDYEPITEGSPSGFTWDEDSSIVSSFLNFTLGGQIPFIFQPDNTKQDFAICKLDKASSTIKQVAHGVYSVSMVFVETW